MFQSQRNIYKFAAFTFYISYILAYEDSKKITVTYVPSHLYHMLFELFKNALRAVVEHHGEDDLLPKVHVMICKGQEDLTIKVSITHNLRKTQNLWCVAISSTVLCILRSRLLVYFAGSGVNRVFG